MVLQAFFAGMIFSFVGSIPPGTLNILVLQMGLENKIRTALRFALAVSIVEYPYAWIAVVFEDLITSSPLVLSNFQLTGATVMTTIGVFSLWSARKPSRFSIKFQESGFRRGLLLSILNPQAIPFWIAITAYLKAQNWIDLSTVLSLHSYLIGTSVGVMILLIALAVMARKVSSTFQTNRLLRMLPGGILILLGLAGLGKYFLF